MVVNLLINHVNSMDSIVRSCKKILVPQLLAGRLILDGYYCVFVLSRFQSFFFLIKRRIVPDCDGKIPFARRFVYPFGSVLSLYILECSNVWCVPSPILVMQKQQTMLAFIACFTNNLLFDSI